MGLIALCNQPRLKRMESSQKAFLVGLISFEIFILAVINLTMFTWSITRRPGDEAAKIEKASSDARIERIQGCIQSGGKPESNGNYCDFN